MSATANAIFENGTSSPPAKTVTLADRIHYDDIWSQTQQARPGRALAAVIGGLFFAIGWTVAQVFRVLFVAGAWCFVSVRMGWKVARSEPLNQPNIDTVLRENAMLRAEVQRLGGSG